MKKRLFIATMAIFAMASCNDDAFIENMINGNSVINASFEDSELSRVAVGQDNSLTWSTGDQFVVLNNNGGAGYYTLSGEGGSSTGTFTGTLPTGEVKGAAYPFVDIQSQPSLTGNTLTMTLPEEISFVEGVCNSPMWATMTSNDVNSISFKHLVSMLKVDLSGIPSTAGQLIVDASSPISGTFTADITKTGDDLVLSSSATAEKSVTVKFTPSSTTQRLFLVPIPVGTYTSFAVAYANQDGTGKTYLKSWSNLEFSRATPNKTTITIGNIDADLNSDYIVDGDTYTLKTVGGLFWFAEQVNGGNSFSGKTVKLGNDIDLNDVSWTPIGTLSPKNYFKGTFDGNGQTIFNLNVTVSDGAAGLFGAVENCAEIKNVKLSDVKISSNHYAGALVGWFQENGSTKTPTISNCSVSNAEIIVTPNAITGGYDNGDKAGALVGYAASDVDISNCSVSNASITGYRDLGGIVGYANSTDKYGYVNITNCTVSGLTIVQDLANGYKNEYPATLGAIYGGGTSPDVTENSNGIVSLTIKNCPTKYAQGALDAANTPRAIELTTGNFGDLLLRVNEASELTDYYYIMGNYDSNYYGQEAWQYAKRTINDLTIKGVEGTIIKSLTTPDARDDDGNVKGTRNNMFVIKNLKISDVTIADKISFNSSSVNVATSAAESVLQPHVTIDGLTIENCKTTGDDKASGSGRKLLGIANTGTTSNVKNIVISGCEVTDMYQGVYIVDGENVKVENCTFNGLTHNAVHLNKFCSGTISVTGNNMSSITERPIRLSGIQSGNVTITGNIIISSGDSNGEYYKASSMGTDVEINWDNNTADGTEIVLSGSGNDKIGKK